MATASASSLFAIVGVNRQTYALPAQFVREVVVKKEYTRLPGYPAHIRGVINLRGVILPLMDLRLRMNLPSSLDETAAFCTMMRAREQDHLNWLKELEASVREAREFKLTTDPHKCAFGKWYDTYKSDNSWIAAQLRKFNQPHQEIHRVGEKVRALTSSGEVDAAHALMEKTRTNVLGRLRQLFDQLIDLAHEVLVEPIVVLDSGGHKMAITIDSAEAVEPIAADTIEDAPAATEIESNGVVHQVGRRQKTNQLVMILDPARLLAA